MLNDPQHVSAAQAFAERVKTLGSSDTERVNAAFRLAVGRLPDENERAVLAGLLKTERQRLGKDNNDADNAWVSAARVVLNLGEIVIRP